MFWYLLPFLHFSVLVTDPAPGANASGSAGSFTWARNRFGSYARNRTKPVNPNSARQQKIRGLLATLTARWANILSDAQRTAWNLYGDSVAMKNRVGQTVYLTGFNHYLRTNVILGDMAQTYVDDGPTVFELPEKDATFALVGSEATQVFTTTFDDTADWPSEDGGFLYFIQGTPQNNQRTYFGGPWRGMRFLTGNSGTPLTSTQELGALIVITQGQRVWGQARIVRADGRVSEPFQAQVVIDA